MQLQITYGKFCGTLLRIKISFKQNKNYTTEEPVIAARAESNFYNYNENLDPPNISETAQYKNLAFMYVLTSNLQQFTAYLEAVGKQECKQKLIFVVHF